MKCPFLASQYISPHSTCPNEKTATVGDLNGIFNPTICFGHCVVMTPAVCSVLERVITTPCTSIGV